MLTPVTTLTCSQLSGLTCKAFISSDTPKPPDVEYIFVEPYNTKTIYKQFGLNVRPFGHTAIRYTLPNGRQVLTNISKEIGLKLVEFWGPKDWFYGIGRVRLLVN